MFRSNRSTPPAVNRRTFIAGAVATGVLAACSSDDGGSEADGTAGSAPATDGSDTGGDDSGGTGSAQFPDDTSEIPPATFTLVQRFPQDVQVPGEVRLPFSLSTGGAEFIVGGPETLGAQVTELDGTPVGPRLTAVRRAVTPADYYAFRAQIDTPGIYSLIVDGGPVDGAHFQVWERDQVSIPLPGDILPGFDTPTVGEPNGVDPICTREPACSFHSLTLSEALNVDRAVAYLVGTPAFCQTGSCAPALEAMIEVEPEFTDDFVFVHAEVFTDRTATVVAPALEALDMLFEPALFITDASGVITERLDGLWDITELRERLPLALT